MGWGGGLNTDKACGTAQSAPRAPEGADCMADVHLRSHAVTGYVLGWPSHDGQGACRGNTPTCVVPLVPCDVPLVPRVVHLVPCDVPPVPCAVPLVPCVVSLVPCVIIPVPCVVPLVPCAEPLPVSNPLYPVWYP